VTAGGGSAVPVPLPPLEAVLLRDRTEALAAFSRAGWRPWATPIDLDAERRRILNLDLTEPEIAFLDAEGEVAAVAHLEAERGGRVTLVELTGTGAVEPARVAAALLGVAGKPTISGGAEARQWVWGPEAGSDRRIGGEPVRLWVCAEQAYGGRLWAVASVVRRGG
jgi:hypothetical protein